MNHGVKEKTKALLRSGERQKAIAYLQHTFNIEPAEATLLVDTLEREDAMGVPDKVKDGRESSRVSLLPESFLSRSTQR